MRYGFCFVLATIAAALAFHSSVTAGPGAIGRPKVIPTFQDTGVQAYRKAPSITINSLDGKPYNLADAWREKPALIVSSSITCPVSRDNCKPLDRIAKRFAGQLNVVVIYTIEAHPKGAASPYSDREWLTDRNIMDDVLVRQPETLAERTALARAYQKRMALRSPIVVDAMDNRGWKMLGRAPNAAIFVDIGGEVKHRHGWLDPHIMAIQVANHLRIKPQKALEEKLKASGVQRYSLEQPLYKDEVDKIAAILAKHPSARALRIGRNGRAKRYRSLIHEATSRDAGKVVTWALKQGVDPNAADELGRTAMHAAAERGDIAIARRLIEHRGEVHAPDMHRQTPLHVAVAAGKLDFAKWLVTRGAYVDGYAAAGLGDLDEVRRVITADPGMVNRTDKLGRGMLFYAAANGHTKVARALMDAGAKTAYELALPYFKDYGQDGYDYDVPRDPITRRATIDIYQPELYFAVQRGHTDTVKALLTRPIDRRADYDSFQGNALHVAAREGHVEIAKALLKKGMDVDVLSMDEETPLHVAAEAGKHRVMAMLLEKGADPHRLSGRRASRPCGPIHEPLRRQTPLHLAAMSGDVNAIKLLLTRNANVNARDHERRTPLHFAADYAQLDAAKLLLAHGGKPNMRDSAKNTSLHLACTSFGDAPAQLALVRLLVMAGADVNARNDEEHTPLDLAVTDEMKSWLKSRGAKPGKGSAGE